MNLKALVEAALFMSVKPLSLSELSKIANEDEEKVLAVLEELSKELEREDRGIYLVRMGDKFKLYVKPEYIRFVRHLTPYSDMKKGLLRVLALVAYKNGITQSEIVKIIGNRTYEYVKELESRGLIRTVKQGRTKVLVPTKEFAQYFGLKSPEEAKKFFEGVVHAQRNDES
jgi:segregation and condensation protein B